MSAATFTNCTLTFLPCVLPSVYISARRHLLHARHFVIATLTNGTLRIVVVVVVVIGDPSLLYVSFFLSLRDSIFIR